MKRSDKKKQSKDHASSGAGDDPRGTPDPEVTEGPRRRVYTAAYKQRILREADEALESGEPGALGALMRREGLYSSHLSTWRRQREAGELAGLTPKKRGRKAGPKDPLVEEVEKLRRENARLQARLQQAETIIDVQKKVSRLLGVSPNDSDDETES